MFSARRIHSVPPIWRYHIEIDEAGGESTLIPLRFVSKFTDMKLSCEETRIRRYLCGLRMTIIAIETQDAMRSILTRGWSSLPIRCNIRIHGIFVLSEWRVRKFYRSRERQSAPSPLIPPWCNGPRIPQLGRPKMNEHWTWTKKSGGFRSFAKGWRIEMKWVKIVHERIKHERHMNEFVRERWTIGAVFQNDVREWTVKKFVHHSFIFRSCFVHFVHVSFMIRSTSI